MQGGDYSAPIAPRTHDEIGVLAGTLNHMREGIARREREILRLAYEDGLTRLPNRALLLDRLEQGLRAAQRRSEPLTVMMLDLDRFKEINDTHGHDAGDAVLAAVASRLREAVRETDTLARLGGDEFGVLLQDCTLEMAGGIAENLRQAIREFRFVWQDRVMHVGAPTADMPSVKQRFGPPAMVGRPCQTRCGVTAKRAAIFALWSSVSETTVWATT